MVSEWNPDAILISSSTVYGTPSYWMQHFFIRSSGASLISSTLQSNDTLVVASVISWKGADNQNYITVKYIMVYKALKQSYPDIQAISNCDGSRVALHHPADIFDYHIYTNASDMFAHQHHFDSTPRGGAKVFVSEYAVTTDAGLGNLRSALAEAAFLMGIEKNSDVVAMACFAPLLVNTNDRKWNPDAIVISSSTVYGTPSYWMQHFFIRSSGASLISSTLQSNDTLVVASLISWKGADNQNYITVKTILTSSNAFDENTFQDPTKRVFYWPTNLERLVWQRYNDIGKKRLRDNMYKVSKRKKAPSFMKGSSYEEYTKYRNSPEFKEASARNKINRKGGDKDAEVEPTHYGGSQSFHDRVVLDTKKNKGKVPTIVDLFVDTHAKKTSKGKLIFAKEKDQQLYVSVKK
ncbi:alpha-L-arabinofuranosidase 1-like [Silene latifolia]|uniref:alpha-L-arabinofuranosidase 1-like n=1 Tax=Silene latifolia TaxID=37657 RepID=UPI003D77E7B8